MAFSSASTSMLTLCFLSVPHPHARTHRRSCRPLHFYIVHIIQESLLPLSVIHYSPSWSHNGFMLIVSTHHYLPSTFDTLLFSNGPYCAHRFNLSSAHCTHCNSHIWLRACTVCSDSVYLYTVNTWNVYLRVSVNLIFSCFPLRLSQDLQQPIKISRITFGLPKSESFCLVRKEMRGQRVSPITPMEIAPFWETLSPTSLNSSPFNQ